MALNFSQSLKKTYTWTNWKTVAQKKSLVVQHDENNTKYVVYGYDGIEVHLCDIYLGEVPYSIAETYSQTQNDLDKADFEANYKSKSNTSLNSVSPFAGKTFGSKKLFKRIHGISSSVAQGSNDILFTIPYAWVKITGIQIVGGEHTDSISMLVLDSTTGTYSTIPNYVLNQFGFAVNVVKDNYIYDSEYDADLYLNMQIKIVYSSASSKTIGVNFILNEVK